MKDIKEDEEFVFHYNHGYTKIGVIHLDGESGKLLLRFHSE